MNSAFAARFPKQLGHWALHGSFNALPSFIIAMFLMELWRHPFAIAGMLSAIGFFIVAFAVSTSLPGPLADRNHMLSRSIRMGTKIRTVIACISIPMSFTPFVFLAPDVWCGLFAISAQNAVCRFLSMESSIVSLDGGMAKTRFLPVFTTTMIEGFIISFLLVMISFFCVIFLQARERKRMIQLERLRNPPNRALPPASGNFVVQAPARDKAGTPDA
jgi:hypothetical protein